VGDKKSQKKLDEVVVELTRFPTPDFQSVKLRSIFLQFGGVDSIPSAAPNATKRGVLASNT
jgi:hypothetical protein